MGKKTKKENFMDIFKSTDPFTMDTFNTKLGGGIN